MYLGIDIGTSATKAVIIDADGTVLGVGSGEHELHQPKPGWTEQPPVMWWRATCSAVRAARANANNTPVKAIGFSGQMHGSVFLDAHAINHAGAREIDGMRPALLWNDQRTAPQCAQIEDAVGGRAELVARVGNAALTGFTLPKILWLRDNEPDRWASVSAICTPKDYIRLAITGELAQDVSDGAGMLLMDVQKRTWHTGVIETLGLDPALFPPLLESAAPAGTLTPWAAEQLGLYAGTLVVAGAGDNQAGAVGAGVVEAGMVFASMGTSGVIYAHAPTPALDTNAKAGDANASGRVHTMCAATGTKDAPGAWSITGCMLSAAGSLQWARDTIAPGADFDELMQEAASVPAGCEGLVFMPHLTGERCPYPDPRARGGWIGLTSRHTRGHLFRAVVEGVTMTMGQILNIVRELGVPVEKARLSGGGNQSELWRQMQADLYGCPVATLNAEEGPAYGGALLAGVGDGHWPTVEAACGATLEETEVREPGPDAERYAEPARVLKGLYEQTAPAMHALSAHAAG